MNTRKTFLLLSALFIAALVYFVTFQKAPPQVMSPVLSFSEFCTSNKSFGRHFPASNETDVSSRDVWEVHVSLQFIEKVVGKKHPVESNYFDYTAFPLRANFLGPSGKEYNVSVFCDRRQQFKIRASLDEPGKWLYKIFYADTLLKKDMLNIAGIETGVAHILPVLVDPKNPSKLLSGDKPFYWMDGKWIASQNVAPCSIAQVEHLRPSRQPVTDQEYLAYLDVFLEKRHNAILIKIAQLPLLEEGLSWDLEWLHRADWMVRAALERGIYVQINLFDTWSRDQHYKVLNSTKGEKQIFNAWQPLALDFPKITQYLRSIVSRFSAYPNVAWKLGNKMEYMSIVG